MDVANQPILISHDYHLNLVAGMARSIAQGGRYYHCIHAPWPSCEYMVAQYPATVLRAMLEGMLQSDKVVLLTEKYAVHFLDICSKVLGAACDYHLMKVTYKGRETFVQGNPISCNFDKERRHVLAPATLTLAAVLREKFRGRALIGRAERSEVTKGIVEGFQAFKKLLGWE